MKKNTRLISLYNEKMFLEIPKAENSVDLKKMSAKNILSTFDELINLTSILNRKKECKIHLQRIDQKTLSETKNQVFECHM